MSGVWKLDPLEEPTQKPEPSVSLATLTKETSGVRGWEGVSLPLESSPLFVIICLHLCVPAVTDLDGDLTEPACGHVSSSWSYVS